MREEEYISSLKDLFKGWCGEAAAETAPLPGSGSHRKYFRIRGATTSSVGVFHPFLPEYDSFVYMTGFFGTKGLPVPRLLAADPPRHIYLLEDLGDTTLMDIVLEKHTGEQFPAELIRLYKNVIDDLLRFQLEGREGFDFSRCYPVPVFDKMSMRWDLDYFKYCFLKPVNDSMDESKLEADFKKLVHTLSAANANYFMYRDFQSRNILVKDDRLYYVDYQGGRKGPLQYDLVSLLFQARARIPEAVRQLLMEYYLGKLEQKQEVDRSAFTRHYYAFALLRLLQALGAYGYRGWMEGKAHFLRSLKPALDSIQVLLQRDTLAGQYPYLDAIFRDAPWSSRLKGMEEEPATAGHLTVSIHSFSYRNGIPADDSGHGGGFIFDCRVLSNPGRMDEFRNMTGLDREVIRFFEKDRSMKGFVSSVYKVAGPAIEEYMKKERQHLMISFGCTGGQHRSVYAAEKLASWVRQRYRVRLRIVHHELDNG